MPRITRQLYYALILALLTSTNAIGATGLNYPGGLTTQSAAGCVKWVPDTNLALPGIQGPARFESTSVDCQTANAVQAKTYAALGTPDNGTIYYCTDCTEATPCAGGGTGAFAQRVNGAWKCASGGGGVPVPTVTPAGCIAGQAYSDIGGGCVTLPTPDGAGGGTPYPTPTGVAIKGAANTFTQTNTFSGITNLGESYFITSTATQGVSWDATTKILAPDDGTIRASDVSCTTCVDISSETNLAVTAPITLTGDTIGFNSAVIPTPVPTRTAVAYLQDSQTFTGANTFSSSGTQTFNDPLTVSSGNLTTLDDVIINQTAAVVSVLSLGSTMAFEGAMVDNFETFVGAINPTADNAIDFPDESGTVCTTGSVCSGYQASGSYLTSESDPQVGTVTSTNFCHGDGSGNVACTDSATYLTTAITSITDSASSATSGPTVTIGADNAGIDTVRSGDTIAVQFDATEVTGTGGSNPTVWSDGTRSNFDWGFNVSTGTDPNINFTNNAVRVDANSLIERGASPTLSFQDTDFSNTAGTTLTTDCASTSNCSTNLTYRRSGVAAPLLFGDTNGDAFLGDSTATTKLTVRTDGTGDGEVVLPFNSIQLAGGAGVSEVTGTLPIDNGGTGTASTLTGLVRGSASAMTAAELSGEATTSGSNAVTLTNSAVIGKVLTGYTSGAGTVAATDTILQAIQKLNGNDATNANLTGDVTSVGNATSYANTVPIAKGGTNSTTALSGSSIMVSDGSKIVQGSAGTTSTVLHGNASGVPSYGGVTSADITDGTITTADLNFTPLTSVTVKEGGSTVTSTATALDFVSTDFDVSGTTTAGIALDANVVKVGGASILSSQIPTVFAADGVSRCFGDDNDWCGYYSSTLDLMILTGVRANVGPTPTASTTPTPTATPTSTAATATATAPTPTIIVTPTQTGATATPTAKATPPLAIGGHSVKTCIPLHMGGTMATIAGTYINGANEVNATRDAMKTPIMFDGYFTNLSCALWGNVQRGGRFKVTIATATGSSCTSGANPITCTWSDVLALDVVGTDTLGNFLSYNNDALRAPAYRGQVWQWTVTATNYSGMSWGFVGCEALFCSDPYPY